MFHRRPLDTIWHRLPIRHVSFKRRKQSMKDTRKIERSPLFTPPPLWWVLLFGCGVFFLRFVLPDVHSRNRGGSCRQPPSPRPYLRCPGPARGLLATPGPGALPWLHRTREAKRGADAGQRTHRPCGSQRPAPSAPAGQCFCGFYLFFFLRKGVKWRHFGRPASALPAQSGAGRRSPCAGAVRAHLGCGSAAGAGVWGARGSLGDGGGPFPWRGGERSFRRRVRGRRASGALSQISAERKRCGAGRAGSGRGRGCAWAAEARGSQAGT